MVMFKRYGQLLLKMLSLSEESTPYHLPQKFLSRLLHTVSAKSIHTEEIVKKNICRK